jgi:ribosomal protein L31
MFGNKNKIKLKNDSNNLTIDDLQEDVRDPLIHIIPQHQYCATCGEKRNIKITRIRDRFDTRTGKPFYKYTVKLSCSISPQSHPYYSVDYDTYYNDNLGEWEYKWK